MGLASWAKMTSLGGKLKASVCHPTKKVNKAEELTHLSANIGGLPPCTKMLSRDKHSSLSCVEEEESFLALTGEQKMCQKE